MKKIVFVASNDDDVVALISPLRAFLAISEMKNHVLLTGAISSDSVNLIKSLPDSLSIHNVKNDSLEYNLSSVVMDSINILNDIRADMVVVTGEQPASLAVSLATHGSDASILNLHGRQSLHDSPNYCIRRAISALSHLHCVPSIGVKKLLLTQGEEDWRIEVTGLTYLDEFRKLDAIESNGVISELGIKGFVNNISEVRLIDIYPEAESHDPSLSFEGVLGALDLRPQPTIFIMTSPKDMSAAAISIIKDFVAERPWAQMLETISPILYANLLRGAALLVANSSAGLIEAGIFGLPVVHLSNRETHLDRGENVAVVPNEIEQISRALVDFGPSPKRYRSASAYGDGYANKRIARFAINYLSGAARHKKTMPRAKNNPIGFWKI